MTAFLRSKNTGILAQPKFVLLSRLLFISALRFHGPMKSIDTLPE